MDPAPTNTSTQPDEPSYSHAGNGKVARLPAKIRDQIGVMLLDGVPHSKIIAAIGEYGTGLSENNVGNWKAFSFKSWKVDYERRQAINSTRDAALALVENKPALPVQDAGRTIAAAQLYELLLSFDPSSFAQELANKPELYIRLVNALSRLSEGEATCGHRRLQESLIQSKLSTSEPVSDRILLTEAELKDLTRQVHIT